MARKAIPITKAQIAKIWVAARELGMERRELYQVVPRGSISHMTRAEAGRLIDYLIRLGATPSGPGLGSRPHRHPRPGHKTTQEQRDFIYFLFGRLGWLEKMNRVKGFLRKYAGVERIEDIRDRKRAIAIIEALKAMYRRQLEKAKELCEVG